MAVFPGQAAQGLNDYRLEMDRAAPGLLYDSSSIDELSKLNSGAPLEQTIADITVGGTIAAGNAFAVSVSFESAIGTMVTRAATYTAVANDTAAIVAGKLRDAIAAEALLNDYLIPTVAAAVLSLKLRQGRKISTIACTAGGAATITASPAITNPAAPALIKWGYFAAQYPTYSDNQVGAVTTNTGARILGINKLYHYQARQDQDIYDSQRQFGILAFHVALIVNRARIWVPVSGTVARGDKGAYINATGQPCKSGTAGSTDVPGTEFFMASGSDGLAVLSLNLPA